MAISPGARGRCSPHAPAGNRTVESVPPVSAASDTVGVAPPSAASGWLSRAAYATGFPSIRSLVMRSLLGIVAVTLVQRFALYPSTAAAFDVSIAISAMAIMLLFAYFIGRARHQR